METECDIKIKCLIWDLDNTLWNGVLLEDEYVTLRSGITEIIQTLDQRGILQSIASRNDHDLAMAKLESLGLKEYFIYPQINWSAKSASVQSIAKAINIGIDTIAFIDDQPFEREEVTSVHAEVLCLDAADLDLIPELPAMMPHFITDDSKQRRRMYQADAERNQQEEQFIGAQDEFLGSLDMVLTIAPAKEADLERAEELTVRTNQLNTTGYSYSYNELNEFRTSTHHHLLVAGLEDKYGTYGKIGLALIEMKDGEWWIRLFLMSCRVMNRGVGTIFINHIRNLAREAGVQLMAEMIPNDRNRMMYMTYKFNHFQELESSDGHVTFKNDLTHRSAFPDYMKLILEGL
ncbi:MAG: HAD-IIIC family phosphatase [Pontiella sp.]